VAQEIDAILASTSVIQLPGQPASIERNAAHD
jgi:hypothetical protein